MTEVLSQTFDIRRKEGSKYVSVRRRVPGDSRASESRKETRIETYGNGKVGPSV